MSNGLCCPKCGYDKSYVKETRPFADGIRRRRECEKCRHRFTTYECGNDMLRRIRERAEKMANGRTVGGDTMGKMICTKEAREACDLAYMCEENAEVMDDSECADLIVKMEAVKWDG